jgi:hypothetical protein
MKTFMNFFLACIIIVCAGSMARAQTTEGSKSIKDKTTSKEDKAMNKRLANDILARFPLSKNSPIIWDNTGDGYIATYAYSDNEYMTRYDRNGSYQGTFIRRDWDTQAPSNTRNFFNNSRYGTLKVGSYWEVQDGTKQGSFIVASNEQGAPTYLFIDEQGQFSENPFDN